MSELVFKMDDNGTLSVDVFHLLHELPEDRHLELAESLSCSDVIIAHVMDQVLHECTKNGFSGSWSTSYDEPLQKYRMDIAKNSSDIAKNQIEELEQRLQKSEKQKNEYSEMYYNLYHKLMGIMS